MKNLVFIWVIILAFYLGSVRTDSFGIVKILSEKGSLVQINTPDSFEPQERANWKAIGKFLVQSQYKTYVLNWRGYGGNVSDGEDFINQILKARKQRKTIIIKLIGNAYSIQALIPCYTDIQGNNKYYLMYHRDSIGDRPVPKVISRIENELAVCKQRGILTQTNINDMYNGMEVYVTTQKTWCLKDER